ncbi:hypothetical protein IWX46DRAFT_595327 [Phyllosticta citricarpa]|uniref:Uncharacterized protein n=1 Tax=Phyllosticta citricarpa TaxID=55181 RepID=A0ABR1MIE4_9PEZI
MSLSSSSVSTAAMAVVLVQTLDDDESRQKRNRHCRHLLQTCKRPLQQPHSSHSARRRRFSRSHRTVAAADAAVAASEAIQRSPSFVGEAVAARTHAAAAVAAGPASGKAGVWRRDGNWCFLVALDLVGNWALKSCSLRPGWRRIVGGCTIMLPLLIVAIVILIQIASVALDLVGKAVLLSVLSGLPVGLRSFLPWW